MFEEMIVKYIIEKAGTYENLKEAVQNITDYTLDNLLTALNSRTEGNNFVNLWNMNCPSEYDIDEYNIEEGIERAASALRDKEDEIDNLETIINNIRYECDKAD